MPVPTRIIYELFKTEAGISLAVQWLSLQAANVRGAGSIPGRGSKILHAAWCGAKKINNKIIKKIKEVPILSPSRDKCIFMGSAGSSAKTPLISEILKCKNCEST